MAADQKLLEDRPRLTISLGRSSRPLLQSSKSMALSKSFLGPWRNCIMDVRACVGHSSFVTERPGHLVLVPVLVEATCEG